MVWNIIIPAAATLIGAKKSSSAAKSAAGTAAAAAESASDTQRQMFERQVELQEPFREIGLNALRRLEPLASEYTPFGMNQFQADPGYAFRMSEGMKALERGAAARGGLLSGAALKGAQRFGQDLASQEYQNAFNRYQTERSARLNPLQSLANVGQTTAQQLGEAGRSYANTLGNINMNQAAVKGQAGLSRASTYGSALNQLAYLGGRYMGAPAVGSGGGYGGGVTNFSDWG
jgi:hypothetical protein